MLTGDNCPTERASLVGPLIESLRPLPARPFCGVDRLTFSFLNRSLVSTAILTQAGIFLKSTVAIMAASMRALRLFERSIA